MPQPAVARPFASKDRSRSRFARWCVVVPLASGLLADRARAQAFSATVQAPAGARPDGTSAVSVIELGLPGQPGAPSAYKVSVAEALHGQPGLTLRQSGGLGQWSGALLRGSAAPQTLVLLDGVPLSRGGQTASDLSLLPADGIERIEVHRGAPPFEAGAEGVGGAIELFSRRGRSRPVWWGLVGAGSFGLRKLTLGYSGGGGELRTAATVSYQGSRGDFPYLFNEGLLYGRNQLAELWRQADGFDQGSADLSVRRDGADGGWFVQGHGLLKRQGVPGIGQPLSLAGDPTLTTGRALLHLGGHRYLASRRVRLGADAHALLERSFFHDPTSAPPRAFEQLGQQAGLRLLARLASSGADPSADAVSPYRALLLLAELRYERAGQRDLCPAPRLDCAEVPPTSSHRLRALLGLGGELRVDGDRLLLEPGLHVLVAHSELLPLSETAPQPQDPSTVQLPAPRVAARLRLLPWLLARAGAGRFVRLPSFLELFGDRAFFRPNPTLRPESAWSTELGLRAAGSLWQRLQLSLEAHGFHRRTDDLIDVLRDGPTLRARNVGTATAAGLELEVRARLGELVAAQLSYTFLEARDQTDVPERRGKRLPGRPPHSVWLRLDGGLPFLAARAFYELDYASEVFLDPANLQPRPARALHAVGIQLGPLPQGRAGLQLAVEMRNLLDTRSVEVQLPLSPAGQLTKVPLADFFDYPLPGRALYATLSVRL